MAGQILQGQKLEKSRSKRRNSLQQSLSICRIKNGIRKGMCSSKNVNKELRWNARQHAQRKDSVMLKQEEMIL